ncbi:MAG: serine/threonine-protein kinase [Ancalomicrobiaceae bacterium]|nr:serine/threonine-protein kinase [Ancalomicrobiaceae bacterium]
MVEKAYRDALAVGTEVGGYRITRVLGQGGFGITYAAVSSAGLIERQVAIKEFFPNGLAYRHETSIQLSSRLDHDAYAAALKRFEVEARKLVDDFDHPNIVRGENVVHANGSVFLVMDYIDGEMLFDRVVGRGRLDAAEIRALLEPVLDAVDYLHAHGTMHRDLSPKNIMIRTRRRGRAVAEPVLIDFGAVGHGLDLYHDSTLAIANPNYAPPDQQEPAAGRQGRYTDIFAAAGCLYFAATGRIPAKPMSRLAAVSQGEPDPLLPASDLVGDRLGIDARFLAGIDQGLRLDPKDRPLTIADFRRCLGWDETLGDAGAPTVAIPRPTSTRGRRRRGLAAGLVAAAAVGGLSVAGIFAGPTLLDLMRAKPRPAPSCGAAALRAIDSERALTDFLQSCGPTASPDIIRSAEAQLKALRDTKQIVIAALPQTAAEASNNVAPTANQLPAQAPRASTTPPPAAAPPAARPAPAATGEPQRPAESVAPAPARPAARAPEVALAPLPPAAKSAAPPAAVALAPPSPSPASGVAPDAAEPEAKATIEDMAHRYAALSQDDGPVASPRSAPELYHNARRSESRGEASAARRAYLDLARLDVDAVDVWLRFATVLRVQDGRAGAATVLTDLAPSPTSLAYQLAAASLAEEAERGHRIAAFVAAHPDYGPGWYLMADEVSESRLGSQTLTEKRQEREALAKFLASGEAGDLARHFLDPVMLGDWLEAARRRKTALDTTLGNAQTAPAATFQRSNAGWSAYVQLPEAAIGFAYRLGDSGPFTTAAQSQGLDPRTGKPPPNTLIAFADGREPAEIDVRYTDLRGREVGPFTLRFDADAALARQIRDTLELTKGAWVSFRDFGGTLMYTTHLVSYRCGLTSAAYALNGSGDLHPIALPPCDRRDPFAIPANVKPYLTVPATTATVRVVVTYKDGTTSETVIPRR